MTPLAWGWLMHHPGVDAGTPRVDARDIAEIVVAAPPTKAAAAAAIAKQAPIRCELALKPASNGSDGAPQVVAVEVVPLTTADVKSLLLLVGQVGAVAAATTDPLTGLADRRQLASTLDAALVTDVAPRLAVLFLDLDEFKQINDRDGHLAGDEVLRELAQRWQSLFRSDDLVTRFGGDEFVVLLRNIDSIKQARQIADRLVAETRRELLVAGKPYRLSACVGVAYADRIGMAAEELLEAADRDMYRHKRTTESADGRPQRQ
ncbi:MAG: GGDEF domain-containing protein [Pirellulales bacterium]|nr:GGDEF domain-containing protein [Pirellulales bacterium]